MKTSRQMHAIQISTVKLKQKADRQACLRKVVEIIFFRLIKNAQMQGARNPEEQGVPGRYVVDEG
jgi:hypothetical protein